MQSSFNPATLLLIGTALVLAFIGAKVMKRFGIPQILGFMLAGLFLGVTGILDPGTRTSLFPLVDLALGLIGYNIGLELRKDVFSGQTRRMSIILISESILTFGLVTMLAYFVIRQLHIAIVFGALASATDPASTVMVIWERKCKGNLTDTLMFVLAMDDVIAILLANISISIAVLYYSTPGSITLMGALLTSAYEIFASSIAGGVSGAAMAYFINRESDRRELLELELGVIILLVGLMSYLHLSSILACMVFGFIVGNYVSSEKDPVSHTLNIVMTPIVMIFFVIVGASIDLSVIMQVSVLMLALLYVGGRTFAKYFGAYGGAKITDTPPLTSRYLGLCLMSQAGVAVGLSLVVELNLISIGTADAVFYGTLILNVIVLTTMILQVFGPIAASEGLRRAGEYPRSDYGPEGEVLFGLPLRLESCDDDANPENHSEYPPDSTNDNEESSGLSG
ncbi:MAG: cation:proton antiporter [Candidatus Hodarchaeota archaeon]